MSKNYKVLGTMTNPLLSEIGEIYTESPRKDGRPSRDYYTLGLSDQQDILGKPFRMVNFQGHYFAQGVEKTRWDGGNPKLMATLEGKPLVGHTVYTLEVPEYTIVDQRTKEEKIVNKRSFLVRPGQKLDDVFEAWLKTLDKGTEAAPATEDEAEVVNTTEEIVGEPAM